MTALSPSQIAAYAYQAGFRGQDLTQAVAIALAESSGNPQAYNPESAAGTKQGAGSYGLWQIYSTAHPQYDRARLFDPAYNASAAFQVYREAGNKFTPWSTYNQGISQQVAGSLSGLTFRGRGSGPGPGGGAAVATSEAANAVNSPVPNVSDITQNVTQAVQDSLVSGAVAVADKYLSKAVPLSIGTVLVVLGFVVIFHEQAKNLIVNGADLAKEAAPLLLA